MATFFARLRSFLASEDGPTATEYAFMLALIVVVSVGAIGGVGTKMDSVFTTLDTEVRAASGS